MVDFSKQHKILILKGNWRQVVTATVSIQTKADGRIWVSITKVSDVQPFVAFPVRQDRLFLAPKEGDPCLMEQMPDDSNADQFRIYIKDGSNVSLKGARNA